MNPSLDDLIEANTESGGLFFFDGVFFFTGVVKVLVVVVFDGLVFVDVEFVLTHFFVFGERVDG